MPKFLRFKNPFKMIDAKAEVERQMVEAWGQIG